MALHATSVIGISLAAAWLLSPPVLAVLALRTWKRERNLAERKPLWPVAIGTALLANWVLFVTFLAIGQIGGFGSHHMTTRLADVFLLVSLLLLITSFVSRVGRWRLSSASFLMLALWVGSEMVA
jgi:hypothetical protein